MSHDGRFRHLRLLENASNLQVKDLYIHSKVGLYKSIAIGRVVGAVTHPNSSLHHFDTPFLSIVVDLK
jgi:hypothetical protein